MILKFFRDNEEFYSLFDQIILLTYKEINQKYKRTALGFLWSFLVPLLQTAVFFWVFQVVMRFEMKNYLLYLVSGIFIWQAFANMLMSGLFTLLGNAALIKRTACIRFVPVCAGCLSELIHLICTFPVLFGCMYFSGVAVETTAFLLVPLLFLLLAYGIGLGMILGIMNLFYRDLERIVSLLLQLWFFITPVFYPVTALPEDYSAVLWLNPFFPLLELARLVFYSPGGGGAVTALGLGVAWSIAILSAGIWCYRRNYRKFAECI